MRRQPLLLRQPSKHSSQPQHQHPAQHHRDPQAVLAMVEADVMDGEIILAIATRRIPVHAATATIVIAVAATETKELARKVGLRAAVAMKAAVAMGGVMEVVHVETVRAVAAVRDDRTRALATTRMAVAIRDSEPKAPGQIVMSDVGRLRVSPAATRVNAVTRQRIRPKWAQRSRTQSRPRRPTTVRGSLSARRYWQPR
jgi:hypothetical protein